MWRWLVVLGCTLGTAAGAPVARADDWELLAGYAGRAAQLWALPSGDTLALGDEHQLWRTADDGDSWQPVPGPPGGHAVQVDPHDPSTIYGSSEDGISVSTDGGSSWRVIYPSPDHADPLARATTGGAQFAVSPADHTLLYFAHTRFAEAWLERSRDGGVTWATATHLEVRAQCAGWVGLLMPHPTDPRVVYTDLGCYAGRNRGTALRRSTDQGATWSTLFKDGQDADVSRLVDAAQPGGGHLYLTGDWIQALGPARLFRSDDDGASWALVLQAEDRRAWRFGGLAVDPIAPDTVWVALGFSPNSAETGVRVSTDAGETWAFLGRQDIGWVNDLVRTADGQALLAATNEGIWRYGFAPGQPEE